MIHNQIVTWTAFAILAMFKIKPVFVPFYVQIFTFSFFCGTIWTFLAVKNMAQLSAEVHLLFHQLAIEPFATLILRYGSAPIYFSSFFISSSGMPTIPLSHPSSSNIFTLIFYYNITFLCGSYIYGEGGNILSPV